MNKGYQRRKLLFDKFSSQLSYLRQQGYIKGSSKYDNSYLCPLCLNEFSENDVVENPSSNYLTLEDAPPEALGGTKIALTCKTCNSEAGHKLDFHLIESIRETDNSYFYSGSKQRGTIDFEGKKLSVELTSEGDGTLTAYHRIKNNDPSFLDRFIFGIKEKTIGPILNYQPPKSRVESRKVGIALLKTHYIISFAKFGYLFLMDKTYSNIREQIRNPDKEIFSDSLFIKDQFSKDQVGTYYVKNNGIEALLNVFMLKTNYSETIFAGLLPVPTINFSDFLSRINERKNAQQIVTLDTNSYDVNANLFSDAKEMKKVWNWIAQAK